MQRDTQRSRVYKCDRDERFNSFLKPLPAVKDIERFVKKVFASKRVQTAFPKSAKWRHGFVVKDGRGRRAAGGWYGGITMPVWARNEGIVLHELAHTICQREHSLNTAHHGWEFCAIYLKLVLYTVGREAHDALKAAMKANRVRFTAPRKRKPLDPERRAILAARLATYRAKVKRGGRFAGLELDACPGTSGQSLY